MVFFELCWKQGCKKKFDIIITSKAYPSGVNSCYEHSTEIIERSKEFDKKKGEIK